MQHGKVEILVNDQGKSRSFVPVKMSLSSLSPANAILSGNRITPSYVAFTDEERLVGDAAKNQAAANPTNTIFDIK